MSYTFQFFCCSIWFISNCLTDLDEIFLQGILSCDVTAAAAAQSSTHIMISLREFILQTILSSFMGDDSQQRCPHKIVAYIIIYTIA